MGNAGAALSSGFAETDPCRYFVSSEDGDDGCPWGREGHLVQERISKCTVAVYCRARDAAGIVDSASEPCWPAANHTHQSREQNAQ